MSKTSKTSKIGKTSKISKTHKMSNTSKMSKTSQTAKTSKTCPISFQLFSTKPSLSTETQLGFIPAERHFSNLHLLQLFLFLESMMQAATVPQSSKIILH